MYYKLKHKKDIYVYYKVSRLGVEVQDHIFVIAPLYKKARQPGKEIFICFVDLEKNKGCLKEYKEDRDRQKHNKSDIGRFTKLVKRM